MALCYSSCKTFIGPLALSWLIFAIVGHVAVDAQSPATAPAPAPTPASDGTSIDQGIAYVLMLLALVVTYLIHPLDASSHPLF